MKLPALFVSASALVALVGCVQPQGRTVYSPGQINQAMRVELGTVVGVRSVMIEGQSNSIGTWGGGAMGAAATGGIASGTTGAVTQVAGGIAGAIVGEQVQKAVTAQNGYEITVVLDNGDTIVIVQETDRGGFMDGDRVRVMIGQGSSFVLH